MRILLTQLRRIGDVITTTPAVRAVRTTWKDATIDYLTEPPSDEIFRCNPYIDNIITIQRRPSFMQYVSLIKKLRANNYDVVIDFFCNPTSAYISFLSGAKRRIGFERRVRRHFYHKTVNTKLFPKYQYAGCHKLALVANIGVFPAGFEPEFFIDEATQQEADELLRSLGVQEGDTLITLGAVVRHAFRQWPLERFAAVADALIERYNAKILFIYGPGEEEYPRKIQSMMKHKALPEYPHSGIGRLRGIFERAKLHIGCDNGPANIAKASPAPSIVLYSNSHASSWTPPDNPRYITLENDVPCKSHCLHEKCPNPICVSLTTVEEVLERAEGVLDSIKSQEIIAPYE